MNKKILGVYKAWAKYSIKHILFSKASTEKMVKIFVKMPFKLAINCHNVEDPALEALKLFSNALKEVSTLQEGLTEDVLNTYSAYAKKVKILAEETHPKEPPKEEVCKAYSHLLKQIDINKMPKA